MNVLAMAEQAVSSNSQDTQRFSKITGDILEWFGKNAIKLVVAALLLWIGWKVINVVVKKVIKLLEKNKVEKTICTFSEHLLQVVLKIVLVICLMEYVGIQVTGIAALLASAGLAVGLALQGSLANFAGGVIILLLRPFKIGDFIETSGFSGTVESIKIFYTYLLTPDNKQILIPNGILANGSLVNYSSKPMRRVDIVFGVGYETDLLKVRSVLYEVVKAHNLILKDPEPFVALSEQGESALNFVVRAWCNTEDYWTVYFDLLEQVKLRFDEEGISIPYPQMDVHLIQK